MKQQIVVNIISVKKGKTQNWLVFSAYIGCLDSNRKYSFDFCGTELLHSLSLKDEVIDDLKNKLIKDFGYAPYDIAKCKKILGKGLEYVIY